jgi:hypothetical protein
MVKGHPAGENFKVKFQGTTAFVRREPTDEWLDELLVDQFEGWNRAWQGNTKIISTTAMRPCVGAVIAHQNMAVVLHVPSAEFAEKEIREALAYSRAQIPASEVDRVVPICCGGPLDDDTNYDGSIKRSRTALVALMKEGGFRRVKQIWATKGECHTLTVNLANREISVEISSQSGVDLHGRGPWRY